MNLIAKLRQVSKTGLPLILGIYLMFQPVLDILTALGIQAGHSVTAGVVVRTLFMVLAFLYVVLVSRFRGKTWCLLFLGVIIAYLALFMLHMFRMGGLALCIANVKELVKVFFAPFVVIFLYAVYREYGHLISTRTIAIAGGLYAGFILLAFLTGTSFQSYVNSGHGYKGWFFAANEVSCILALTAPIVIYFCLKQLTTISRKTWWKLPIVLCALASIVFSANFLGTKVVFGITLLYCGIAMIWALVQAMRERSRTAVVLALAFLVLCVAIAGLYFFSPLQTYLTDVYIPRVDGEAGPVANAWNAEIMQASEGTWLRELIENNSFVQRVDQLLSRRLLSASPSVQVYTEGSLITKLLGIGYGDTAAYSRSIQFMVELDPVALLVRHGIAGFLLCYVPYLAGIFWLIVQFFRHPLQRLASLEYSTYLYAALVSFAISTVAGHALVSPAVSTFVMVICLRTWAMTRKQPSPNA